LSPSEDAPLLSCDVIVAFSEAALSGKIHSFSNIIGVLFLDKQLRLIRVL